MPALTAIAPSTTLAGTPGMSIVAFGSNFTQNVTIDWNGTALPTTCGGNYGDIFACPELTATVPASDLATTGSASVTLTNLSPPGGTSGSLTFTITPRPTATTWVRTVAGITVPWDEVWDSVHGRLYVSTASQDPTYPNAIIPIDPVAGTAGAPVAAGNDPRYLTLSSDSSYLWTSLVGSYSVQRFLLPGLTPDISFPLPLDSNGKPQQAVSLQAAPVSPHTVALVAGYWQGDPSGDGVYIYDDATPRPTSLPGWISGGPMINWLQWGQDDSTIYATSTDQALAILPLQVNASGVTWNGTGGGLTAALIDYDRQNGLAYSRDPLAGGVYNPALDTQVGGFRLPVGDATCTADSVLERSYCITVFSASGVDIYNVELWVFDLNTYALVERVYFGSLSGSTGGSQPNSPITGTPQRLIRWGNAGLALITSSGAEYGIPLSESAEGAGGVFLIDGAAVNPNVAPDVPLGTSPAIYASLSSMSPQAAPAGSGDITLTIQGANFTEDSTACWDPNSQVYLPTQYVSATKLIATIPAAELATAGAHDISVFDPGASSFSTNALDFTVTPASGNTQITPLNLAGLSMAWDANSQLLYIGAADYDAAYPNSIVAVNPQTGTIVNTQSVSPDPDILSDSAGGQFLYAAFADTDTMTQFSLPSLAPQATWLVGTADDIKAAPVDPHTTAVSVNDVGVVIFDDAVERPTWAPGWLYGPLPQNFYEVLAWGSTDSVLASARNDNVGLLPLYTLNVTPSGVSYEGQTPSFNDLGGAIHSDFGNGLVYSDAGMVADPATGTIEGSYGASGLVAPDSSLNRVFILGQTAAQVNSNSYTIQSFDEKAFTLVSSITLNSLAGTPIQMVRWGNSGLAILTSGGIPDDAMPSSGTLYILQDGSFVSNAERTAPSEATKPERVQRRWKPMSKKEILAKMHRVLGANEVGGDQAPDH
ncbi:MAG: IPT/TIG domain-containing protein [Acidobacteriaceae bacterium]